MSEILQYRIYDHVQLSIHCPADSYVGEFFWHGVSLCLGLEMSRHEILLF